ncbi:zinc ribbon domain-containing protein [uncultured Limosilactobacillus sp.]|uniref:zinc ribbon domain-containing protein n=1 Tax=uncultured Limosilactobacillus sp. TaxID=2837629 RepID=UPI002586AF1D|nr:zinc ribbon domain-containing protein [uncultured Limosilactobacillus sp.]
MKICPRCNTVNDDQADHCVNCGATLTKPILALVCPNCGKVSALGTTECPVCHTKLSNDNQKVVKEHLKLPNKKRTIIGVLLLLIIAGALFLVFSFRYSRVVPVIPYEYLGMTISYQDRHHHTLFTEYYVIKQKEKGQRKFQMAYLGRGNIGKSRFKLTKANFAYQYRHRSHYLLNIKKDETVINRPHRLTIKVPDRKIISAYAEPNSMELIIVSSFPRKCTVQGEPGIDSVNIKTEFSFQDS